MARRVLVVVSYVLDRSHYPRGGSPRRRRATYWSSIAVQARTLHHVAPDVEFVACTTDTPTTAPGRLLASSGARVQHVPFAHRPPTGFYARYVGSLYLLDTLPAMGADLDDDDVVLFVDPDVVWARSPDPLVAEVRRGGVVAYELVVPPTLPMCTLTRADQGRIVAEETNRPIGDRPLTHFGGELYGMTGHELRDLAPRLEQWWDTTLERFARGADHFVVEEHLFNALLWERREQVGRANPFVQRVRTLPPPLSTRNRVHDELVAWHLPYEKDRGFPRLLRHLAADRPVPPPGPAYRGWLRQRMGVQPTPIRWAADRARQVKWVVQRRRDHPGTRYGL